MRAAPVLAGALCAALAGCGSYTEPVTYSDGRPIMNHGKPMTITLCCTLFGIKGAGPTPRGGGYNGFFAGHGMALPGR